MNPVSKLLRHNLSLTQTVGFVLANLVGLTIVVAGLMIYLDAKPIWNGDDSFMKTDYVVVNKRVSMQNTLGASTAFTPAEVADLKARPWVRSLAPFTTADFRVSASITAPGQDRGLNTFLFFESLPREYVDVEGSWTYKPGDATVPVIMSRDYLALYNFGFATSAGLPQVSEKMISSVPLQLNITSNGTPGMGTRVQARIVGFSSRLNTILVPQEFMDWANATYGTGASREPSRIIIDTNSPGDVAITDYIDEHGWEIGGDKSAARASFLLNVATGVVLAIGVVITALSFFVLFLSISLLMQKNRPKLHSLLQLGYPTAEVARPYRQVVLLTSVVTFALAVGASFLLRGLYIDSLRAMGGGAPVWLPVTAGLTLTLLTALLNTLAIRRRVVSAFYS